MIVCGDPAKATMFNFKCNRQYLHLTAMVSLTLLLCACGSNANSKSDTDKTIISSCDLSQKMGTMTLSSSQQTQICAIMVTQLNRHPPVYLLRDVLRLAYLVRETATNDSLDSITLEAMKIIRLRQQQNNDEAIQNTLDIIWKIYQSTQTQVTFDDLDQALTRISTRANIISDEDLEKIGIALWQKKLIAEHMVVTQN
jgi:hypothetical protein